MEFHLMLNANRTATLCVLALLAVITAPSMTRATPVNVDGSWNSFTWNSGVGANQNETPFTFTTATSVVLDVTDAFGSGDRFNVMNNGGSLGITSQVNGPVTQIALNGDQAWAQPNYSHGTWALGPGSYSLTFVVTQVADGVPPGTPSQAFFRVSNNPILAEVPEPASLALLALSGVALAFRRVRRRLGLGGQEPQPAV
jgi:hypothetical protein